MVSARSANVFKKGDFMTDGTGPARPLSPHLQIWRFTLTMAGSILHRITGVALYGGVILLVVWLFALAAGGEFYAPVAAFVGSPVGLLILFGFAWSLMFHTLNGLRHLYWDSGRGLAYKTVAATSRFIFAGSLALTVLVFVLALSDGSVN